ncbi:MAG: DUF4382 domain-containing protein [Salinibacter sp.]
MKRHWSLFPILTLALGLVLVTGCDSTGVSPSKESGTMELSMAGASGSKSLTASTLESSSSADSVEKALVTISEISIVPTADTSQGDSTATGVSVLSKDNFEVDLMKLQAGLDTTVTKLEIPSGEYSQIRLITADKARVTFKDGTQRDVMIASGQQTGLKVNFDPFTIDSSSDSVDVTLNWNVQQSLKGNMQGNLVITPVIDATVNTINTGS